MRITTTALTAAPVLITLLALPGAVRADDFADTVVSFSPAVSGSQPTAPHLNADQPGVIAFQISLAHGNQRLS